MNKEQLPKEGKIILCLKKTIDLKTIRDRRESKRSSLGGQFKVIQYYDNWDNLIYIESPTPGLPSSRVMVPHDVIAKSYIKNSLGTQIQDNNSKQKKV